MARKTLVRMTPAIITILYASAGLLWVYVIDQWLVARCGEGTLLAQLQLIDGLFTIVTAWLLYWLMQLTTRRLRDTRDELETRVQERTARLSALNEQLWQEAAQRKHTEEALRESEARYRSVVETQSDLICHFKPDGTLTFVNSAYCAYFQKTPGELIGQDCLRLISPEDLVEVHQAIASLNPDNPRTTLEYRVIKPTGELGWQQWTACIVSDEQGRVLELQGVGRDISERKHAEDKLRQLQAQLAHAAHLSIAGAIAKNLAHELNQPLTAIVTYTQASLRLLKTGKEQTGELLDAMEHVAAQGLRAGEIIRRLRNFTHAKLSHREMVDIGTLIREVASLMAWKARQQQVSIRLELAEDLLLVSMDITQIQQVLLNLLNNAIETVSNHSDERQITLRAARAGSDTVEVVLLHSGPGLPKADLDKLFESFLTTRSDSPGVGLALSRSLVEAQGGRLWVTSNPDHSNTFRFTLPLSHGAPK